MKSADRGVLERLLERGFLSYAASPPARARALDLPAAIAGALARGAPHDQLAELRDRILREHWPALVRRQAGSMGHGWDALMAVAAVVVELVLGALPAEVERHLAEVAVVEQRFIQIRRPFQRFALIVEGKARPARMLASTDEPWPDALDLRCPPDLEHHPALHFTLDAGPCDGRSHTLLLALLALERWAALELPDDVPLAATGVIAQDGRTIEPVDALAEKRRAWFAHEKEGLFISAPPRSHETLKALLRSLHARADHEWLDAPEEDEPNWKQWIVAGSLDEVHAKLEAWAASRRDRGALIPSWDGKPLSAKDITSPKLEWERPEGGAQRGFSCQDPILSALWHVVVDRPGQSGVIVYGEPGIGKSVLSHLLEQRFRSGLLGALGFAVRRSAREFAEDVEAMPGAPLAELLARRERLRLRLFRSLLEQRRLFLILDGLDEVAARLLPDIARPIRQARPWFVATSRDVRLGHDALPPHLCLKIEPLRREHAVEVLRKLGRDDLGEQIEHRLSSTWSLESKRDPIAALCRTPFHLHLLANVVAKGARVDELDPADLYRRAFAGLLEQAVGDGRLRHDQADLLRRQGHAIAGELALAWLRSPQGVLTDVEISVRLERVGLIGREAVDMQRALEFGYLLTPGVDNLAFTHRTLAEWAAASALSHRVRRRIQEFEKQPRTIRAADRATAERTELEPLLSGEGPVHESRLWQLLRFYAPSSVAPLALVEVLVGPAAIASWKDEHVATRAFEAALEIAASARWAEPEEAQTALGLFARARLFSAPENGQSGPPVLGEHAQLERFVRAIALHVPPRLVDLVALVARTPTQRAALEADPTRLLPFCPRELHEMFRSLLRRGTPAQQAAILERYAQWEVEPPWDLAERLAEEVPARIRAALPPVSTAPLQSSELEQTWRTGPSPEEQARWDLGSAFQRIEAAVYLAAVRAGRALPWPIMQRRLLEWPQHLEGALLAWFREGRPRSIGVLERGASEVEDPAGPHRREAFSLLVTRLGELEAELFERCRAAACSPEAHEIAGSLYDRIDQEDSNEPWHTFTTVARRAGWNPDRDRHRFPREEAAVVDRIVDIFRRFAARRKPVQRVLRALGEVGRLDALLGELWPVWRPGTKERRVLLDLLLNERQLPPCIEVAEVIAHLPPNLRGLPYELEPSRGKAMWPKHEAQWREMARGSRGRERFLALLWCAQRDGHAVVDVLAAVAPEGDAELTQLIDSELKRLVVYAQPPEAPLRAPEKVVSLPLAYRARVDAPGWRGDLLAALDAFAPDAASVPHDLLAITRKHGVREALPILRRQFEQHRDLALAGAIAELMAPDDRETIRMLVVAGRMDALPKAALEHLTLEDLPLLLGAAEVPYRLNTHTQDLWRRVARFGPPAHRLLRAALEQRREELNQARAQEARRRSGAEPDEAAASAEGTAPSAHELKGWVSVLEPLVIETVNAKDTPTAAIVELLFALIGGDRHHISSSPGPLGSEYDEPHDLEYSSQLVGAGTIAAAKDLLGRRLASHPEEAPMLERLLHHPSETLHLYAFEELARRTPPYEVARLGVHALEAHVASTDTRTEGETIGVMLAQLTPGGSGSVDVRLPEVGRDLARAVRRHLTHADRDVLFTLTQHRRAAIRRLACGWIAELGTPDWANALAPVLEDASPEVVMAALRALITLDQGEFGTAIAACSRRRWRAAHYGAFIEWVVARPRWSGRLGRRKRVPSVVQGADVLRSIAGEAVEAACSAPQDWRDRSVPSAMESFLQLVDGTAALPADGPLSNAWLRERARASSGELQAALYRTLARRGAAEIAEDLAPQLALEGAPDALLAAEILPTVGSGEPTDRILQIWEAELDDHAWSKIHDSWPRILYMLERAPVAYAPLLPRLLSVVRTDLEGSLTEESGEILARMRRLLARWGPDGAGPLLRMIGLAGRFDGSSYAKELLVAVYRGCAEVREELWRRTAESSEHASLAREFERPTRREALARLRDRLLDTILPAGWSEVYRVS
ncbi:NACHT domain-containing protein [Sorangium sp. So ce260]|uniref:NACHT domain-containing protein n=1 Tax=Sorangium sp. So ce260 TaxID=3133291 RepID=UPI003F61DD25